MAKAQPKKSSKASATKSASSNRKETPKGKEKNKEAVGALFEAAEKEESKIHRVVVGAGGS